MTYRNTYNSTNTPCKYSTITGTFFNWPWHIGVITRTCCIQVFLIKIMLTWIQNYMVHQTSVLLLYQRCILKCQSSLIIKIQTTNRAKLFVYECLLCIMAFANETNDDSFKKCEYEEKYILPCTCIYEEISNLNNMLFFVEFNNVIQLKDLTPIGGCCCWNRHLKWKYKTATFTHICWSIIIKKLSK